MVVIETRKVSPPQTSIKATINNYPLPVETTPLVDLQIVAFITFLLKGLPIRNFSLSETSTGEKTFGDIKHAGDSLWYKMSTNSLRNITGAANGVGGDNAVKPKEPNKRQRTV